MLASAQMLRIDDMIITIAYFSIPLQILCSFLRYRRVAAMQSAKTVVLAVLFALFIFLCGTGHLLRCLKRMDTTTFYIVNWFTAFISLATALYLLPLVPNLLGLLDKSMQDLIHLNEEMQESKRKLVTFMAFLCHEMRSPLFAVTSFCSFLEDEDLTSEQESALNSILQSVNLMLRLVNDVLDINQLEAGRFELEMEEFQLQELIKSVAKSARLQLKEKPLIEFSFSLAPNVPRVVCGDRARILQITYNLLSNAAKFTDTGRIELNVSMVSYRKALQKGWIQHSECGNRLESSSTTSDDSEVILSPFDSHFDDKGVCQRLLSAEEGSIKPNKADGSVGVLMVEVKDTGSGISPNLLERLFTPYSWSKLSEYRQHGGTGLGLAILAQLSKKMGGSIHVASTEHVGSTFTVYIQVRIAPTDSNYEHKIEEKTENETSASSLNHLCALPDLIPFAPVQLIEASEMPTNQPSQNNETMLLPIAEIAVASGAEAEVESSETTGKISPCLDRFIFRARSQKVLVVDDNHMNRKLIGRMLNSFNLEYELAVDGREAVSIMMNSRNVTGEATGSHFGLVIMDISMPVLDGCQATRILRALNISVPILALTACAVDVSKQEAIDAGVTEFLLKPILRGQLYEKCRHYLLNEV